MATPFDAIERTPRGHFLLHFYAAVLRLLAYIDRAKALGGGWPRRPGSRYPFLARYRAEIERLLPADLAATDAVAWWEEQVAAWQAEVRGHLPLVALERTPGVGPRGRAAFVLAGLVEEDSRFGTVLAELQEPLPGRRLALGLLSQLLAEGGQLAEIDPWDTCRGLFQMGALEAANPASPRSEWLLQAPGLVWDAARGSLDHVAGGWCVVHAREEFPAVEELTLPAEFAQRLAQTPALLAAGQARALVLRGTPGSERLRAAGAVARAMQRQLVEIVAAPRPSGEAGEPHAVEEPRVKSLAALCILANAAPLFSFDLGPGETVALPDVSGYAGPVVVLMGLEGGLRGALAEQALTLVLPAPDLAVRLAAWQEALGSTPVEDLEAIASRFVLPTGYIRQTAAMAIAQAALDKRRAVRLEDVRHAARALNRQMLDNLAERVAAGGGRWDQLVVGGATLEKLRELERRCTYRERLLDHLGRAFRGSANRGVRALLSGPSGTGKTLAARILAAELGMDLYRVDLASVINKYIGETEKNLHRVLSHAEELDVILLLDEGDALLGQRTDVKSSNDRYANLETNYLLQRLENYQGIVLITTNAAQNIDPAFQRRMDVVVNFVPPQADERWAIWQLHMPAESAVQPDFLARVAAQCDLTGGQIRNAALLATLLAVSDGSAVVEDQHVIAAVRAEYRKAGAVFPLDGPNRADVASRLDDFVRLLV